MFPYLDLFGFCGLPDNWAVGGLPTGPGRVPAINPLDVAIVEAARPGFCAQRIKSWSSEFNARFRKRYGKTTPMGQTAPLLLASGTTPPAATLQGRPVLGSMAFVLSIVAGGALGTATFTWSSDGGQSAWSSVESGSVVAGGIGYTAPTLSIAAPAPGGTQATGTVAETMGVVTGVTIVQHGSGYSARYPATLTISDATGSGAVASPVLEAIPLVTGPSVPLPGSGVVAIFGPTTGAFAADNVYASDTAVPEAVLAWISACLTVDCYQARGVNPQDAQIVTVKEDRDRIYALLKELADSKDGTIDLPLSEDEGSAVTTGGPLGHSSASPYVGFDEQRQRAMSEDYRSFGR